MVLRAASDGRLPAQPGEGDIAGVLEQPDLLSFLSNHSYLVTRQIVEAPEQSYTRALWDAMPRLETLS